MELRHLTVFVAVAEERSFSRAADRLRVVQSAVSATIRNLEREWGLSLFHRTTHHVELSSAGREMLPVARAALRSAEEVDRAVDEIRGGLRGTIRLGVMQATFRAGGVSPAAAIAALRAEHPGVTVDVRQGGSTDLARDVRAGELDVAFVGVPERTLPGLALTVLRDAPMGLACHPDHPLARRAGVTLVQLAGETFADVPPEWGVRVANDLAFAAAGVRRDVAFEINDVASVVDFVRHGLAVAILAAPMVPSDAAVALVPIRGRAPRFRISIAEPADRPAGAAARAFVAAAVRTAAA